MCSMNYYSFDVIIYDNGLEVFSLLIEAMEKECLIAFEDSGKDEDGYLVNQIRVGISDSLSIDILNKHLLAIDGDLSWNEINVDDFFRGVVFDKNNSELFLSPSYIASIEASNQRTGNEICIPDDDLFRIETLGLNQSSELQFLQHGYQFVEDILDKMNQKFGHENLLIILGNDEIAYRELLTKLKAQGHI